MPVETEVLRKSWGWLLLLGIGLIILGCIAIAAPLAASLAMLTLISILLIFGGVVQVGSAVWARGWRGFTLHLLAGVLYLVVGLLIIENPARGLVDLTLLMAAFFLVGGIFRIVTALVEQFHGWGWVFLNGVITLALGILIWKQMPQDAYWVIGVFVGIDMLFNGWAAVMAALALRALPASGV